uniref:Uncharacterized protein n=1 Tax=Anguilla anguilla TaxID=7936 RepID=A0A0E9SVM4_ANGAN
MKLIPDEQFAHFSVSRRGYLIAPILKVKFTAVQGCQVPE